VGDRAPVDSPVADRAAPADEPATTTHEPPATTYRRRPGLLRRVRGK